MQRRDFLKLSATAGAVSCVTACGGKSGESVIPTSPTDEQSPIIEGRANCSPNCGAYCPMTTKIQDGRLIGVDIRSGNGDQDDPLSSRPCLRGRSSVQRQYSPDRIQYPMKRVPGTARGAGQWQRISWEQAISEIGAKLKAEYEQRPNGRGIMLTFGYVGQSMVNHKWNIAKVLNDCGGLVQLGNGYSWHQVWTTHTNMFGFWDWTNPDQTPSTASSHSTMSEAQYSDLIVSFGRNPMETAMAGYGNGYIFNKLRKEKEVIFIDPKYTDSHLGYRDEHHFIRPGTDAALCEAMAYVLIHEDNILNDPNNANPCQYPDRAVERASFLREKCYGFDAEPEMTNPQGTTIPALPYEESYKAHILGEGSDGTPAKTPEWAAPITGIPADKIRHLARKMAKAKAPYILGGYGLQRQINGEDQVGAMVTFGCLLGAVGKRGTNAGASGPGQIPAASPAVLFAPMDYTRNVYLNFFQWANAIEDGENVPVLFYPPGSTLGTNIKVLFTYGGNPANQHSDANRTGALLRDESKIDLHVVLENHMTTTAKVADYVLPESTVFERQDIFNRSGNYNSDCLHWQATHNHLKPIGEVKTSWEIARLLAAEMGVEESFTGGRTYQQTVEKAYTDCVKYAIENNAVLQDAREEGLNVPTAPATYQELQEQGGEWGYHIENTSTDFGAKYHCALWEYVNTDGATLNTRTGKIGIYLHTYAEAAASTETPDVWPDPHGRYINSIPKYTVAAESYEDKSERFEDYPLQCISCHGKGSAHSFYKQIPWVKESSEHCVWVHPKDAPAGCNSGDKVIVESLRGKIKINLRITPRIMPGVISLPQGGWYDPQSNGVDNGGCMNTLTQWELPTGVGQGNAMLTNRVRIYKA